MTPVTVVFVDRNRIQFYESRDANLASLEVPSTMIRDLEITDSQGLAVAIRAFLNQHRITASNVVIVLSDTVTMSTELVGTRDQKDEQFQQFLSAMPFEMVQWHRYSAGDRELAVAFPKAGVEPLMHILEEEKFPIIAVVPVSMLGKEKNKRWLDAEMGKFVAEEAQSLVAESLMQVEKVLMPSIGFTNISVRAPTRLTIFIGIFVILVIALLFLLTGRL